MNLYQLKYFLKLAEVGHYGRTSKELFISQPTLSNSIIALEKELGVSLFDRSGKKILLNDAGKFFYRSIKKSLNEIDDAVIGVGRFKNGAPSDLIRIFAVSSVIRTSLPSLLSDFSQTYPDPVYFEVIQTTSFQAIDAVREGLADLAFCGRARLSSDIESAPFELHDVAALINSNSELANQKIIEISELKDQKIASYKQESYMYTVMNNVLNSFGISFIPSFNDEVEANSFISSNRSVIGIALNTAKDVAFPEVSVLPIVELSNFYHLIVCSKNKTNSKEPVVALYKHVKNKAGLDLSSISLFEESFS